MKESFFATGMIHIASMLYLSLVLAFVLSVAEHDKIKKILFATVRRCGKLVGVLVLLACVVHLISGLT